MYESERLLCKFLMGYCDKLIEDFSEEELDRSIAPGMNPPRWILTHMALGADYALQICGQAGRCPKEWHDAYGPGSKPNNPSAPKIGKEELRKAIHDGYAAAIVAAESPDPARLGKPHRLGILENTPIQTLGHLLSHLLTTHFASHVGQLSANRRSGGRDPLF